MERDPESLVAVSNCFWGFQGMLQINYIAYEITPKRSSATFEHQYKKMDSEKTQFPTMKCGLTEDMVRELEFQECDNSTLMQSGYEGWRTKHFFLN